MIPARECAPRALGALLRHQPLSDAKVQFAWRTAVGESMARVTSVTLAADGTLHVHADGDHWRRETARSAGIIRQRLAELLGRNVVKRVAVKGRN